MTSTDCVARKMAQARPATARCRGWRAPSTPWWRTAGRRCRSRPARKIPAAHLAVPDPADGEGQVSPIRISSGRAEALANRQGDARAVAEWKGWGPDVGLGIRCDDVMGIDIDVDDEGRGGGDRSDGRRGPRPDAAAPCRPLAEADAGLPAGRADAQVHRRGAAGRGRLQGGVHRPGRAVRRLRHPSRHEGALQLGRRDAVQHARRRRAGGDQGAARRAGAPHRRALGRRARHAPGARAEPIGTSPARYTGAGRYRNDPQRAGGDPQRDPVARRVGAGRLHPQARARRGGLPAVAGVLAPLSGQHGRRDHDALARARRRRQPLRRRRSPRRLADPHGPAARLEPAGLRGRPPGHADGRSAAPGARAVERCG